MGLKIDGKPVLFGVPGPQGEPGVGIPAGGEANQILAKKTDSDYDTQWVPPPPQYNLPIATTTTLGGVKTSTSRYGISVNNDGVVYRNGELNTNINTISVYLSNNGDDSTATGSRTAPFKTILGAINYLSTHNVYNNIMFSVDNENETYIITESIAFNRLNICFRTDYVTNTALLLHNILYFYDCNLVFEGCKSQFDNTNYYMYLIGNTKITL